MSLQTPLPVITASASVGGDNTNPQKFSTNSSTTRANRMDLGSGPQSVFFTSAVATAGKKKEKNKKKKRNYIKVDNTQNENLRGRMRSAVSKEEDAQRRRSREQTSLKNMASSYATTTKKPDTMNQLPTEEKD